MRPWRNGWADSIKNMTTVRTWKEKFLGLVTYRGHEGQWSYTLHRLTGIGVFVFLLTHILDTAALMAGPEAYNRVMSVFRYPVFRVGEVFLFGAVLYHSLNGVRVAVVDLTVKGTLWQKKLFWGEVVLFVLLMVPTTYIMLAPVFFK